MAILLVILVLLLGFLAYVATRPSQMQISRELVIGASPEAIFPFVNSSRRADEWMPWRDDDPQVKMVYSGPEEGVGSTSSWTSVGRMGVGQAVIVESVKNQVVKTQLSYTKPMQMSQLAEFSLKPVEGGTLVRWSVFGKNSFVGRFFCVFMDMEKIVGGNFEKGLRTLKGKVETQGKTQGK